MINNFDKLIQDESHHETEFDGGEECKKHHEK